MMAGVRSVVVLGAVLAAAACGGESTVPHAAAGSAGSAGAGGDACNPVHFEDSGVEATLGPDVLELGAENVTTALLSNVTSLAGLECLTVLDTLEVTNGTLTDLTPLAGLTSLGTIELQGVPVTDVSPLAGLVNLSQLALSGTDVDDVRPLAELELVSLSLGWSKVSDLAPLVGLTRLKILSANDSPVTSLEPLVDLPVLDQIDVSRTPLTSMADLGPPTGTSSCPKLKALEAPLDTKTIDTTIPALCDLGWNIEWSEPGTNDARTCGPGCEPRP